MFLFLFVRFFIRLWLATATASRALAPARVSLPDAFNSGGRVKEDILFNVKKINHLTAASENRHHAVVSCTHGRCVLGNRLHAVWHGLVVLAHDALAVAGIHVRHLDTAGAVAASAV